MPNEADEVQRKSYVTYIFSVPPSIGAFRPFPSLTMLESRAIISASGATGLRTWESALHLGNYLLSRGQDLVRDKHVLELGAGTGFLSILCAKHLKARHVAATDGDEGIVNALRENIFVNGLEGDSRIESLVLRWATPLSEVAFADESAIDVVVGADIVCKCLTSQPVPAWDPRLSPETVGIATKIRLTSKSRRRMMKTQSVPWFPR